MSEEQKLAYIDTMISKTARAMRKQMLLPQNMKKELWFTMTEDEVMIRIKEELKELEEVISSPKYMVEPVKRIRRDNLIKEAADVCNFLGFLIDNQGGDI